jgi:hypothetical protein
MCLFLDLSLFTPLQHGKPRLGGPRFQIFRHCFVKETERPCGGDLCRWPSYFYIVRYFLYCFVVHVLILCQDVTSVYDLFMSHRRPGILGYIYSVHMAFKSFTTNVHINVF